MNFSSEASKLLTNKYFLYFMVFLAGTNVLGYLVTNKLNAVIFFALVSILTYQFSKNMAVILLIAVIATNFMMSTKIMREGLENATASSSTALEKAGERDPDIKIASDIVQNSGSNEEAKQKLQDTTNANANSANSSTVTDPNNVDLNTSAQEAGSPEGFGEKMSSNQKGKGNSNSGSRIDYAATIEQSYGQLNNLLDGDSLKNLSKDTQSLMQKQQQLFDTMQNMVPVLEGAQNMLKGFDIGGLTKSLGSLQGLGVLGGAPSEKKQ